MSRASQTGGSDDRTQQLIAAVNEELVAALRRADALRAEADAAREAVQQASEERIRFFQYANHEMRSPLGVLLGQIQLARRWAAKGDHERVASSLAKVERSALRLVALSDRALRLTELEGRPGEFELMDLVVVSAEAVERFRGSSERHRFSSSPPDGPLLVRGRRVEIEEVLENLLSNAVKYSVDGGVITVGVEAASAEADRPMAVVRVHDHGTGIPEEHQHLLFQPFYRAPHTSQLPGSGLGLAICAEILTQHGGRIWLEQSSGHGSTFAFAMPLASGADPPTD